eukprot:s1837_g6.t1
MYILCYLCDLVSISVPNVVISWLLIPSRRPTRPWRPVFAMFIYCNSDRVLRDGNTLCFKGRRPPGLNATAPNGELVFKVQCAWTTESTLSRSKNSWDVSIISSVSGGFKSDCYLPRSKSPRPFSVDEKRSVFEGGSDGLLPEHSRPGRHPGNPSATGLPVKPFER